MISRFWLLLLLVTPFVVLSQDCNAGGALSCNERGTCKLGNTDFSGQPDSVVGDEATNVGGMYCECEMGFTGVNCERTTQFCDGSSHVCYHGGKCVKGTVEETQQTVHVCDCRNAVENGIHYVGLHCEKESPEDHPDPDSIPDKVTCAGGGAHYCLNGGSCIPNAKQGDIVCNCPDEYTGYHCEFSRQELNDADANTPEANTAGTCILKCLNGGTCQVGFRNATDAELAFNSTFDPKDHVSTFEHCQCPEGASGALCQREYTQCGKLHCFHGSECTTNPQNNEEYCRCQNNGTTSFAGLNCQHHSTTFCTTGQDLNGNQFCTNDGKCVPFGDKGGVYECECPDNFKGQHCEFPAAVALPETHQQCNLVCANGGKCAEGEKDGLELSILDIKQIDEVLNNTASRNTDDYEHCVCPTGFAGDTCETEAQVCPNGQHVCFHKSICVTDGEEYKCDCGKSAVGTPTAGRYCEHKATTVCNASTRKFCVNQGVCGDNDVCDCPAGLRGPHCEFIESNPADSTDDSVPDSVQKTLPKNYKNQANETLVVAGVVVSLLAIVIIIVTVAITAKSGEPRIETGPAPPPMAAFPPSTPPRPTLETENDVDGSTANLEVDVAPVDDDDTDHVNELL